MLYFRTEKAQFTSHISLLKNNTLNMMGPLRAMCFLCAVVMVLGFEECTVNCSYCTEITLVDHEQFLYLECFFEATDSVQLCRFFVAKGYTRRHWDKEVEYVKDNRNKCVFKIPLQELYGEGDYTIPITTMDESGMWKREGLKSITLSSPTAKIEACGPQTDGKNNFVKYGANISCVCTSDDDVLPRGTANWYHGNKKLDTTHTENGTRSTLILTSVTEDPSQNDYTCVAESAIGNHSELLNLTLASFSGSGHEVYDMALVMICCMVTIFGLLT